MDAPLTEANRLAWNEAMGYHQKARGAVLHEGFADPGFTVFDRDCDKMLIEEMSAIDFMGKSICHMPCNNGRELLSLIRLGASRAVGFDISDEAIAEARQLAQISGLNARFERVNILEIDNCFDSSFDFIYISEGSLQWFSDLDAFFGTVSRLLKPGGLVLIFEMHPFAYFFEGGYDPEKQNTEAMPSYFDKGPYGYANGLDYIGDVEYEAKECFWYLHTMSDIIGALLGSGIVLREFSEYNFEMANNATVALMDKFPLSYLMKGEKGS